MHYTAFLEGLSSDQVKELISILSNDLCHYLNVDKQKSKFTCPDKKNFKILKEGHTFFYYNPNSQLLETEYPKQCQKNLIALCKKDELLSLCIDFFKKLKFSPSETEAYMLSHNAFLFSQSPRIYKNTNKKITLFYDGIIRSEFGLEQIFANNAGLVLGHIHTDSSFYHEVYKLLPLLEQEELKAIYLELPYSIFSPLFKRFNKNKDQSLFQILAKLKESELYEKDKQFIKNFRILLIAAKKAHINVYACDIMSFIFTASPYKRVNIHYRIKLGDACMIRIIEKLQCDHQYPKFLALLGLAHANNVAEELGVPSCFVGEKKQLQAYPEFSAQADYLCQTQSRMLYCSKANFFSTLALNQYDQKKDPGIKTIIKYWTEISRKFKTFSLIPIEETEIAKEVYIEYILEKSSTGKNEIVNICQSSQALITERLGQAIYPKRTELIHPKNWFLLIQCRRPYGIRLTEAESDAFTLTHLNALASNKTTESSIKLHYA